MNKEDIIIYLTELVKFRDNEYREISEFNNFLSADSEAYLNKTAEIKKTISELKNDSIEFKDAYLRTLADFDNYKKRIAKERNDIANSANKDIIKNILLIVDDIERAMNVLNSRSEKEKEKEEETYETSDANPIYVGVQLVYENLIKLLDHYGCKRIECNAGDVFDVNFHNAISTEDNDEIGSGNIIRVYQNGYTLNGRLLRAAVVAVAK